MLAIRPAHLILLDLVILIIPSETKWRRANKLLQQQGGYVTRLACIFDIKAIPVTGREGP
jgi:hypothetical protein